MVELEEGGIALPFSEGSEPMGTSSLPRREPLRQHRQDEGMIKMVVEEVPNVDLW